MTCWSQTLPQHLETLFAGQVTAQLKPLHGTTPETLEDIRNELRRIADALEAGNRDRMLAEFARLTKEPQP